VVTASIEKKDAAPVIPALEQNTKSAPPVAPHQATLQNGMTIAIRLSAPMSISFMRAGAMFGGELVDPLVADGFVIAERGAPVAGRVVEALIAGRSSGTSRLLLWLTDVNTSDGQQVAISTQPWMRLGDTIPAETVIRFRLNSSVTITERQVASR
jgi:hypothetical protein